MAVERGHGQRAVTAISFIARPRRHQHAGDDVQSDLLTIGGGFSGLVTGCRAAQLGLKAVVLEARTEERYPCSSRYSTGVFGVMGISLMNRPEVLTDAIMTGTDGTADPDLARVIAANAERTKEWLEQEGARFEVRGTLSESQHILAPPRRFDVAGLDWDGRGADLLMHRLEAALKSRGGQIFRGTHVDSLIVENGACVGVSATCGGKNERFAAKAVVIADGGFAANPAMVSKYITPRADRVLARVGPGAMGSGIAMAEAAGASIGGFGAFYGHLHHKDAMSNAALWPYPHFDAIATASMLVGPDGKRFADEGLGGVYLSNAIAQLEDPLSGFVVFDAAIWSGGLGRAGPVACNPTLESGGGWLYAAPDIAALADKAGLPAAALVETVRQYNEAVASRRFGGLAVPRSTGKIAPLPITTPPFYAAPLCAGITGTMGGVKIDSHAQALRPDGKPFAGLYAVGTPVADLEGGPRAGYVGGLCKGFVLGLLAAEHAASIHT
jgi:fumarate reductase flavoprotein subunit